LPIEGDRAIKSPLGGGIMKQMLLVGVGLMLATNSGAGAACPNLPVAWVDPGGHPVPAALYEGAVQTCRAAADSSSPGDWRLAFVACMRKHGFKPVYHGIFC
jgi:hypothetical protein